MVSNSRNPRPYVGGSEESGRTYYEDGESDSSGATGLRDGSESSTVCGVWRSYRAAAEGAELAEVRSGDRGGRGWVRDTFDRWDSMVDEHETGTAGGAGESDHPEAESGGRPFEGDRPKGGYNRAGTVAPQTLNASRDAYDPIDARGGGNVNVNRFTLPKDPRELIIAVILAISLLTNLWLWQKIHDADKDIQTQVWLRDDALTKFEQGPFADMKAHVLALEIVQKEKRP